jgi:hypothetical protein
MQLWMHSRHYLSVLGLQECLVCLHKALQPMQQRFPDLLVHPSKKQMLWVHLARIHQRIAVLRSCV